MSNLLAYALYFPQSLLMLLRLAWQLYPAGLCGKLLLELMQGALPLGKAWIIKLLFDLLTQQLQTGFTDRAPQALGGLLIGYTIITLMGDLAIQIGAYLDSEMERRLTFHVQSALYRHINHIEGLAPFENPQFYDTLRLAVQGARRSPVQAVQFLTTLWRSGVTLVAFGSVLAILDARLIGLVLLGVLPRLYNDWRLSRHRFNVAVAVTPRERRVAYYGRILSGLEFAKELRLFNLASYFIGLFQSATQEIHQTQRQRDRRVLLFQGIAAVLLSVVMAGAFVIVILEAFTGRFSLGDVSLYTNGVQSILVALTSCGAAAMNLHEATLFYTHFKTLETLPQPITISANPQPLPPLQHGIEMRDVSFRYNERLPWVVRHLNLTIPAQECMALVGSNGAGKTTLVKMLLRYYDPSEGVILWDGIDIRSFDPHALRAHMGAIFQDFTRYELTAQENIGLGQISHMTDLNHVEQAARWADVAVLIESLPQGYQTVLSRRLAENGQGADLSGGEWQKIALARLGMRLPQAEVLILDEPTAALDAAAEYATYQRFVEMAAGRTTLLISHRFSTVSMADRIAVLEDGAITECGTHAELIALNGTYARLYRMQAERYVNGQVKSPLQI